MLTDTRDKEKRELLKQFYCEAFQIREFSIILEPLSELQIACLSRPITIIQEPIVFVEVHTMNHQLHRIENEHNYAKNQE